jgi:hypothetical protein
LQLTPIERYAVGMMESQMEDEVAEELKIAEVSLFVLRADALLLAHSLTSLFFWLSVKSNHL